MSTSRVIQVLLRIVGLLLGAYLIGFAVLAIWLGWYREDNLNLLHIFTFLVVGSVFFVYGAMGSRGGAEKLIIPRKARKRTDNEKT